MERRGSRLSRRQLVAGAAGLGLLVGCGRLPWQAQQPARVPRIGYLDLRGPDDSSAPLLWEGLQVLGYREGQNLVAEYRYADGNPEKLFPLAAELATSNVELVVARGTIPARAASQAAPRTPVVMAGGDAEVGSGLIASFARPGGNVTGVVTGTFDFAAKWLELLKIALPALSRVALLSDPLNDNTAGHLSELDRAAEVLQVRLQALDVGEPEALPAAFSAMRQEQAEALILVPGGRVSVQRARIAALALANQLPTVAEWREFAIAGGMMSYGASGPELVRRAASYVDKILKGAKPADLPIERPMRFDFVVNMKTAQALGITFPNEIMLQVTEIVQ